MSEVEVMQSDLRQILLALGLGDHARPYSPHEVVQREVLPAIARVRLDAPQMCACGKTAEWHDEQRARWSAMSDYTWRCAEPECPAGATAPSLYAALWAIRQHSEKYHHDVKEAG